MRTEPADQPAALPRKSYTFGEFVFDPSAFTLRCGDKEINAEPQVLSLLAYFVQHPDVLVSKETLLDELWGHRYVSDSALATQIKTLRRVLGDDGRHQRIVKTVHGRGYRFATRVATTAGGGHASGAPISALKTTNLGYERTKLIGRDQDIERCIAALDDYRLVSLLGIGGTGKTRLAKAVGRAVQQRYPDGVWFVDLIPVRDGAGIDTAIATLLGISLRDGQSRQQIAAAVTGRRILFILDNCEHIEDEVAVALDYYLEHTESPRFLATSRDPIDLADELRFFIDPLPVHSESGIAPAAELFLAVAQRHGIEPGALATTDVQQICARLDGLPLAIELAASQLKQLTLDELAERLDQRFEVLAARKRAGAAGESSLSRVVENTWQLLNDDEQRLLGQLAVFPGQFTFADVEEVFASQLPQGISFAMSRLVELCLLSRTSRPGAWWRLLETVRLFALEKLDADSHQRNAQRHATWTLDQLGTYPEDSLHSFAKARWAADHYADLTAAERFFEHAGMTSAAIEVCCAVSLMIQLDDGARALNKLKRIERYLRDPPDLLARTQLHGMAALCAQVTRNPAALAEHAAVNLKLCRELNEPTRLVGALILASLTNNFTDPEQARAQLAEAVDLASGLGHAPTLDLAHSYQAWSQVVTGNYDAATKLARGLIERNLRPGQPLTNPAYNAMCALIACQVFRAPEEARALADTLRTFDEAHSLWGATVLLACADASAGDMSTGAQMCGLAEKRLRRANRSPWPDLIIPASVMAYQCGDSTRAGRWLGAVRAARRPQQTFHTIAVYRQLRDLLPDPALEPTAGVDLDAIGSEALSWVTSRA